jgi:hypothetical protein
LLLQYHEDPKPLRKELPAEEAEATSSDVDGMHSEEALAISVSHLGAKASGKAMENSLSAFASLSSTAEGKDSSEEKKSSSLSLKKTAKTAATSQMTGKR